MLVAQSAAFLTYALARHRYFDAIRASAALSIIAYGVFAFFDFDVERNSAIFFGGTFIGMSAPKRFGVFTLVVSASIFLAVFAIVEPAAKGYGGALGVSAFISVCICHVGILLGVPRSEQVIRFFRKSR